MRALHRRQSASRSPATTALLIKKLVEAREAMPRPMYVGPWPWRFTTVLDDISEYALAPHVLAHLIREHPGAPHVHRPAIRAVRHTRASSPRPSRSAMASVSRPSPPRPKLRRGLGTRDRW